MTNEQRLKVKKALWNYGILQRIESEENRRWCEAIQETIDYYKGRDPIREGLLQLRYLEHTTEEKTLDKLHIGRTTYQKAQLDLLSTLAVFAARRGLL